DHLMMGEGDALGVDGDVTEGVESELDGHGVPIVDGSVMVENQISRGLIPRTRTRTGSGEATRREELPRRGSRAQGRAQRVARRGSRDRRARALVRSNWCGRTEQ